MALLLVRLFTVLLFRDFFLIFNNFFFALSLKKTMLLTIYIINAESNEKKGWHFFRKVHHAFWPGWPQNFSIKNKPLKNWWGWNSYFACALNILLNSDLAKKNLEILKTQEILKTIFCYNTFKKRRWWNFKWPFS